MRGIASNHTYAERICSMASTRRGLPQLRGNVPLLCSETPSDYFYIGCIFH